MASIYDFLDTEQEKEKVAAQPVQTKQPSIFDYVQQPSKPKRESVFKDEEFKEIVDKGLFGQKVTYDSLSKDDKQFNTIYNYATARFGKSGEMQKNESRQAYVDRWLKEMRQIEFNTAIDAASELNWIANAKKEDVVKAGKAFELYDSLPSFGEGSAPTGKKLLDVAGAYFTDPTTAASFVAGAGAGGFIVKESARQAGKFALKQAIKNRAKALAVIVPVEATIGAAEDVAGQMRELKLTKAVKSERLKNMKDAELITEEQYDEGIKTVQEKGVNLKDVAISAGISALFGGIEAATVISPNKAKGTLEAELKNIAAGKPPKEFDAATKKFIDDYDARIDEIQKQIDILDGVETVKETTKEGRRILDEIAPETDLTQSQIKKDINRKAIEVAKYIMAADKAFRPLKDQKISSAVQNVFNNLDKIDEAVLDVALSRAGVNPTEFAAMTRTTVADAASIMQGYSSLARFLNTMAKLDPDSENVIKKLYAKDDEFTSVFGMLGDKIKGLERNSKVLVTSAIGTTVRNVLGTSAALTFDTASKLIENTLYAFGKANESMIKKKFEQGDIAGGLTDIVRDSFSTFGYMFNAGKGTGYTQEVADLILKDAPNIRNKLFTATQATGNDQIWAVSKFFGQLNVAQDAFFRRAIFTASVDDQLKKAGFNMYDLLAENRAISPTILQRAADDALKGTFSYIPKQQKKSMNTLEAGSETLAAEAIKFFEKPGMSLVVPFPRFMANAIAFQYRYGPMGGVSGLNDIRRAISMEAKNPDKAAALMLQGKQKLAKGIVGTSAILAATAYRMENQDTEAKFIKGEGGTMTDISSLSPIPYAYMMLGDMFAKFALGKADEINLEDTRNALIGLEMPAGTQASLLKDLPELLAGEGSANDRIEKAAGRIFGDAVNRFIQPGQPFFQFFDLFREEGGVARDPNVTDGRVLLFKGVGFEARPGVETAVERVQAKLPVLKEELPETRARLREETPESPVAFFKQLSGVAPAAPRNALETEFATLSLDPYEVFGASGDKTYDRLVIQQTYPFLKEIVLPYIKSDEYKEMPRELKKVGLKERMQLAISVGRDLAKAELANEDIQRVHKMRYNRLPADKKRAINLLYKQETGQTMDEAEDYEKVYEYEGRLVGAINQ